MIKNLSTALFIIYFLIFRGENTTPYLKYKFCQILHCDFPVISAIPSICRIFFDQFYQTGIEGDKKSDNNELPEKMFHVTELYGPFDS